MDSDSERPAVFISAGPKALRVSAQANQTWFADCENDRDIERGERNAGDSRDENSD
jgi:hypothetical protein